MDFTPTPEQTLLRNEIVAFARRDLNPGAAERDRDQMFPREAWLACGRMGLQGLPVPEEYGGSGLDPLSTALALEAFGYGCQDGGLVFAVCAHLLACVVPVWGHGTEEQRRRWLPGLCSGELVAVNGMTEATSGSDAFAVGTRAQRDGAGFRVTGRKVFSSNGPVADVALIYARVDAGEEMRGGLTAFLVDTSAPGFSVGQTFEKMGLRSCPIGELVLDEVPVGPDAVLGGVGGGATVFSESMEWERACLVASHLGTMQRLLEQAIAYARTRTSQGQPIGKFQAVSHRIVDMKVRLESARWLVYRASSRLGTARDVGLDASIAKLYASEALVNAALATVQVFGGYGFMTETGVERVLRDAVAGTLYSGTNDVQRNIVARWLGL